MQYEFQLKIHHRTFIIPFCKRPFSGGSKKHAVFMCVSLNANELLLSTPFPEMCGAFTHCECVKKSALHHINILLDI